MRKQEIILRFGAPLGDPDAEVSLRTALNVIQLLVAIDKRSWQVNQARYGWSISKASKGSPFQVECSAIVKIPDAGHQDVVGLFVQSLRAVESSSRQGAYLLGRDELNLVAHLGNGKKNREVPTDILIPNEAGTGYEQFRTSKALRHNARLMNLQDVQVAPPITEYAVVEGYLRTIRVDERRPTTLLHALEVIERDTEQSIWCDFNPGGEAELGSHAGGRVIVEGDLTTDSDGRKRMFVNAYRLIPKIALSVDEVRAKGIRLPDGCGSSIEYVRDLRSTNG